MITVNRGLEIAGNKRLLPILKLDMIGGIEIRTEDLLNTKLQ